MTTSFVAHEQAIVAACAQHELAYAQQIDYRRCISFIINDTRYFVKFGDTLSFASEAATQQELTKVARRDPDAPHVPAIHHIFAHEHLTYAIMEFVETMEVPMDVLAVTTIRRRRPSIADINIADEPLVLTQSDMDLSNFGVDTAGRPVIFDFGQIGWLPESLANYSLLGTSTFASGVSAGVLGDSLRSVAESANMKSMGAVRMHLGMSFSHDLGLDCDGNPRT
ncbi:hypothetical protein K523DRAFT_351558 [Schizophyllum commune Tattone D]|nr:hypothetical protein K523DRAFT_351558 [Schizophyllum commune Tattone D]